MRMNIQTMRTSETELMLRTYMVTPTSTGGPMFFFKVNQCSQKYNNMIQEEQKMYR